MPSLLILKISYVFNNKISITLLSFLICPGWFSQSKHKGNEKVVIITFVATDLFAGRVKSGFYGFMPKFFLVCVLPKLSNYYYMT